MKIPLELYIHIPFCIRKCAYCDFLSGPADDHSKQVYFHALLNEIEHAGDFLDYEVTSIFLGGGTPSAVPGEYIVKIMETLKKKFQIADTAEVSMEMNPGTIDNEKLNMYQAAGINRISFGCQSADDAELKMLGRIHTWEDFLDSYYLARKHGFKNINVDLMSGLPGQTVKSWKKTLRKVAELNPEHISAYSLIVEEGTPFYEMADKLNLPEEEEERQMYEETAVLLKKFGYEQYEISNYAKPGKACEHNIGYWIGREYLGLGLGSSSLIGSKRFHNSENMEEYLSICSQPDLLHQDVQELTKPEQMEEFMMLGLRMTQGVSEADFADRFSYDIQEIFGEVLNKYEKLGYLERRDGRIAFTRTGVSVSNVILSEMLLD